MKMNYLLATLAVASLVTTSTTTRAGEVGIGLSLVNWKKTVNGNQPVPVYYAPSQQLPVAVYQPQAAAPAAPAAPVAAPAASQTTTMVAVPAGNGTYTLVPVVPAQPAPQTYLIAANQVPIGKEETHWSIGPRLSFFANK